MCINVFKIVCKSSEIVEEWTVLPYETIGNDIAAFRKIIMKVIEVEEGYIERYI